MPVRRGIFKILERESSRLGVTGCCDHKHVWHQLHGTTIHATILDSLLTIQNVETHT